MDELLASALVADSAGGAAEGRDSPDVFVVKPEELDLQWLPLKQSELESIVSWQSGTADSANKEEQDDRQQPAAAAAGAECEDRAGPMPRCSSSSKMPVDSELLSWAQSSTKRTGFIGGGDRRSIDEVALWGFGSWRQAQPTLAEPQGSGGGDSRAPFPSAASGQSASTAAHSPQPYSA